MTSKTQQVGLREGGTGEVAGGVVMEEERWGGVGEGRGGGDKT